MYYEPRPRKKRKPPKAPPAERKSIWREPVKPAQPPRRKRRGCLGVLIRLALVALVIWALCMIASGQILSHNFFSGAPQSLAVNANLPSNCTNVLLLGIDKADGGEGRSDAIIVASLPEYGDIKLISVMRDTMLSMGESGVHKANAAYRLGGGELSMYALNNAFGLNLTKYVALDFDGLAQVIDSMGGIELTITKAEMDQINDGLKNAYKKQRVFNGVLMTPLTEYGKDIHMSGTHALFYTRIRKIDSDYKRAERQRILIDAMINKVRRSKNPVMLLNFANSILQCTTTNLSLPDMAALGVRVLSGSGSIRQYRIPGEGAYREVREDGIWMIRPDLDECRTQIFQYIYG